MSRCPQHVVNEADGYQPHIIAPENGYRRLIETGLELLRDPAFMAVEQVRDLLWVSSCLVVVLNEVLFLRSPPKRRD